MHHVDSECQPALVTILKILANGVIVVGTVMWFLSLPFSMYLLLAFDSDVSIQEGMTLGLVHASWVAAIPTALLFLAHLVNDGWTWPQWRGRWLAVAAACIGWLLIVIFWVWLSANDGY